MLSSDVCEMSSKKKSAWAVRLEAERIRLEERLRAHAAQLKKLEAELEEGSAWALHLQEELGEHTTRAQAADRELRSYVRNPLRLLLRIFAGVGRRLKRR